MKTFLLAVLAMATLSAAALATPIKFQISAQPAPAALMLFAKQAGVEVVFAADALKNVRANAVVGEFEAEEALTRLLKGTGFTATRDQGKFVVTRAPDAPATGSVRGALAGLDGRPLAGLPVTILEGPQQATTDGRGNYALVGLHPGTYTVAVATAAYQPLHITGVHVLAGQETALGLQRLLPIVTDDVTKLTPFVVRADEATELIPYVVTESSRRIKPFTGTPNIDLPRSVNDAQPYYVWDAARIERSGAIDMQDFFQRAVTMSTNKISPVDSPGSVIGNTFNANIGGLNSGNNGFNSGTQGILILVNGRRVPGVSYSGNTYQPNINGIPVAAIERIEVLTASASAIYGASAAGGVINVILKQDFAGAEVRLGYENTFSKDSPIRTAAISSGLSLEGGRTSIMFSASYMDKQAPLFQDRLGGLDARFQKMISLYPGGPGAYFFVSNLLFYQTLPLIRSVSGAPLFAGSTANLVQVPAGYRGPALDGLAPLQANVGKFVYTYPNTDYLGVPPGLRAMTGTDLKQRAFVLNITRQMTGQLEAYVNLNYTSNITTITQNTVSVNGLTMPAADPRNPFGQAVSVYGYESSPGGFFRANYSSPNLALGLKADLPGAWKANLDYTWGRTYYSYFNPYYARFDSLPAGATASTPNPMRDLGLYPVPSYKYISMVSCPTSVNNLNLKAAGPLKRLWSGTPLLTIGLEHTRSGNAPIRESSQPDSLPLPVTVPNTTMNSVGTGQTTTGNGVYSELALPLVQKSNRVLGVQQLELQLAGRVDDYKSSVTNPVSQSTTINNLTGVVTYSPATTTGQPISPLNKTGSYRSWNDTVALKYTPVAGVTLRLSFAAGFAPPTMTQLRPPVSTGTSNQTSGAYPGVPTSAPWSYSTLTDPARGNAVYSVPFMSGGNPNLKPETTRNVDWGIILEPGFLRGLRLSVDYQKVTKYDAIVGPTAAQLLANPALFGSRIIRGPLNPGDTFSVGPITLLDATNLNATRFMTSMFNFSLDYTRRTAEWGVWALSGTGSMWQHNVTQAAIGAAQIENLSNPNPGSTTSPGLAKFKGTLSLDWNRGHWGAGWVMRYTGPYTVGSLYGIGGARPVQDTVDGWVSGQIYHDAHVRYRWDRAAGGSSRLARSLRNTTLTLGIKNIFDRLPPYDAAGSMLLYSRYGDVRLASYYVSVRKSL